MAPEAGTERLRHVIRKDISDEQLDDACDLVRAHGIPNLKCYFMIGLPTETDEDVEAIPRLAAPPPRAAAGAVPQGEPFGRLTLSISSFVPKPWTPFQWVAFDSVSRLEAKLRTIKAGVRRLLQRARPPREPAGGVSPGAAGPRGPPGRGPARARGASRR